MMNLAKHNRIAFVLAFVCVFAIGLLESIDSGKPDAATADEYAVYAAAMKDVVGGPSYVVMDTTSIHGKPDDLDNALDFPIKDADRITVDLRSDFKASNQRPSPIAQHFPAGVHVTFIAESERSAMFSGCMLQETKDCGWKAFYAKYSGAPGITSLSRVGFNKNRDAALVYVGNVRDWEVGHGMYLLLEKKSGEWKVISRTRGWIA